VILNPPCSGCCSRVGAKLAVVVHLEGVAVHGVVGLPGLLLQFVRQEAHHQADREDRAQRGGRH
jgi:hypothetical protein